MRACRHLAAIYGQLQPRQRDFGFVSTPAHHTRVTAALTTDRIGRPFDAHEPPIGRQRRDGPGVSGTCAARHGRTSATAPLDRGCCNLAAELVQGALGVLDRADDGSRDPPARLTVDPRQLDVDPPDAVTHDLHTAAPTSVQALIRYADHGTSGSGSPQRFSGSV